MGGVRRKYFLLNTRIVNDDQQNKEAYRRITIAGFVFALYSRPGPPAKQNEHWQNFQSANDHR